MKTLIFLSVVLCALTLGSVSWTTSAANNRQKQQAVTHFDNPVTLQGVVLKGTYLFVHDDAAMKRGEACSRIYKGEAEAPDKLVASFHCIHVERSKATKFTVRALETSPGMVELREFQFAGETAGHGVPEPPITAVVPLVN
jgi:hypothetical protein